MSLPKRLRRKDGAVIYLSSSGHPVAGTDGEPAGYRGVDVDITDAGERDLTARVAS